MFIRGKSIHILIRTALASSGFSFFVSARGCTRITLNVTRLSDMRGQANYRRYIIVLCVLRLFCRDGDAAKSTSYREESLRSMLSYLRNYTSFVLPLRPVNRIANKYLSRIMLERSNDTYVKWTAFKNKSRNYEYKSHCRL